MNWFCLSSADPVTTAGLLRQAGYVAYCPQAQIMRWRGRKPAEATDPSEASEPSHAKARKRVDATVALWPGYSFVCCEVNHLPAAVVLGRALDFLRYTDATGSRGPLRLRDGDLCGVILAELFGGLDFRDTATVAYAPEVGDRVRITSGMWADHFARITAVRDGKSKLDLEKGGKMTAKVEILEAA